MRRRSMGHSLRRGPMAVPPFNWWICLRGPRRTHSPHRVVVVVDLEVSRPSNGLPVTRTRSHRVVGVGMSIYGTFDEPSSRSPPWTTSIDPKMRPYRGPFATVSTRTGNNQTNAPAAASCVPRRPPISVLPKRVSIWLRCAAHGENWPCGTCAPVPTRPSDCANPLLRPLAARPFKTVPFSRS